jgi:hypothetical protein
MKESEWVEGRKEKNLEEKKKSNKNMKERE